MRQCRMSTTVPAERFAQQTVTMPAGEELWLECYYCHRPCAHEVLARAVADWHLSGEAGWYRDMHELIQCGGCKKTGYRNSRDFFGADAAAPLYSDEDLYPRRHVEASRGPAAGLKTVPLKPRTAYLEALFAFTRSHFLTAGTMIRSAVEYVCSDRGIRRGNLETKIDKLATTGLISAIEARLLHKLRFMGNRAVHSGETPTREDVSAGLDVTEHLFRAVYILPNAAKTLPRKNRRIGS